MLAASGMMLNPSPPAAADCDEAELYCLPSEDLVKRNARAIEVLDALLHCVFYVRKVKPLLFKTEPSEPSRIYRVRVKRRTIFHVRGVSSNAQRIAVNIESKFDNLNINRYSPPSIPAYE